MPKLILDISPDTSRRLETFVALINAERGTNYTILQWLHRNIREMSVQAELAVKYAALEKQATEDLTNARNAELVRLVADPQTPAAPGESP